MAQVAFSESLNLIHCARCGIQFGITADFEDRRRKDHETFYCPVGHSNVYRGESDAEKLKRQLAETERQLASARQRADMEAASRRAVQGQATRAKNALKNLTARVNRGVCPHCRRTVKQLAAHIASKHPGCVAKKA